MKTLFVSLLMLLAVATNATNTLTTINGWNAYVHLPASYASNPTKRYPVLFFFPGLGEIGTDPAKLLQNGPNRRIENGLWDGNVVVDGYTVEFIVISLQPPTAYPRPWIVNPILQTCITNYRIDINFMNYTGLSHGGWVSGILATYRPTLTDWSYLDRANAIVIIESQQPFDVYGVEAGNVQRFADWATRGGKFLGMAQTGNGSLGYWAETVPPVMNPLAALSATYVAAGTGGHCCWDVQYGQNTAPAKYMINGKMQDMYEWLARWNHYTVVSLPDPVPPTPTLRPVYPSFDGYFINIKQPRSSQYVIYNMMGQLVSKGQILAGVSKISVMNLMGGVYVFKTEYTTLTIRK